VSNASAISLESKVNFDEMIRMFTLNYSNTLNWVFIMKGHYNNSPRVDKNFTVES